MNLTSPKQIAALLEQFGFSFSKSLGQNFLINAAIPVKIAEQANLSDETTVLEIGPGIGCLTRELAIRAKKVIAVEIDQRLLPVLGYTLSDCSNVQVIHSDVLDVDICGLFDPQERVVVCANLPYYVTTPILMYLLESRARLESITVMVQKEVAQRICSAAGGKEYGAVSAAIRYYTEPKMLFGVSRGSFMPAPNVDSAVIRLDRRAEKPSVRDEKMLFGVIRAGFSQRRKTFVNSVSSGLGIEKNRVESLLQELGLDPAIRAEKLSIEDFCRISDRLSEK